MNVLVPTTRWRFLRDAFASWRIALASLIRGMPLLLSAKPKTPLRVLCIVAFDAHRVLCRGQRLSKHAREALATLLDLGASANAVFDTKACRPVDSRAVRQLLDDPRFGSNVAEYLRRLHQLENDRPPLGDGPGDFSRVERYREAVVRLSLEVVAAVANGDEFLDDAFDATRRDAGLDILFRIAMQCQIIDDVLDYSKDKTARLPSFATACAPLSLSLELSRKAVRKHADITPCSHASDLIPFRAALSLVSMAAKITLFLRRQGF